jgi:hypothetical protein
VLGPSGKTSETISFEVTTGAETQFEREEPRLKHQISATASNNDTHWTHCIMSEGKYFKGDSME